jgi:hypothetical protein
MLGWGKNKVKITSAVPANVGVMGPPSGVSMEEDILHASVVCSWV